MINSSDKIKKQQIVPDRQIEISNEIHLELLDQCHKSTLFQTVVKNRYFINDACDWANHFTDESSSKQFINYFKHRESQGKQFCYAIIQENKLIGCVSIILTKGQGEIGYWLDKDMNGRGYVTQSANALINLGFAKYNCKEIILKCQQVNLKSSNVALRLGFKFNKTFEETLNVNGKDWVIDEYILTEDQFINQNQHKQQSKSTSE
ncbi:GNAT family acetyltransferase (macronuclear) [Tetrahymena thermophila SB210]|uniref:GNAT family acetyltransferase n=1 Tax=Tetrahymena thermophila (strain SB210) TaxID=312017 RepID=Q23WW3_TETTS|nr:GNAT family acetyltransferase [Tetrahymena thermophila SB210]EAS00982.1 GNAT family acetyltransferase [Tetrahymena thermophila SB210]|eukprot:XP_001021227.1 GNAT family acetyltransferase [Tetrahymena thermophila SB210]